MDLSLTKIVQEAVNSYAKGGPSNSELVDFGIHQMGLKAEDPKKAVEAVSSIAIAQHPEAAEYYQFFGNPDPAVA